MSFLSFMTLQSASLEYYQPEKSYGGECKKELGRRKNIWDYHAIFSSIITGATHMPNTSRKIHDAYEGPVESCVAWIK